MNNGQILAVWAGAAAAFFLLANFLPAIEEELLCIGTVLLMIEIPLVVMLFVMTKKQRDDWLDK